MNIPNLGFSQYWTITQSSTGYSLRFNKRKLTIKSEPVLFLHYDTLEQCLTTVLNQDSLYPIIVLNGGQMCLQQSNYQRIPLLDTPLDSEDLFIGWDDAPETVARAGGSGADAARATEGGAN